MPKAVTSNVAVMVAFVGLCDLLFGQPPSTPPSPANQGSAPLRKVRAAYAQGLGSDGRIVGGGPTTIAENPWQVALVAADIPKNEFAQFCGGSIIGARWIVTAAHCLENTDRKDVAILSGTDDLYHGGKRSPVAKIIVHDKWSPRNKDFDIALAQVSSAEAFQPNGIAAVQAEPPSGTDIRITGWGTNASGSLVRQKVLQQATVPLVADTVCKAPASYPKGITSNMLCAGYPDGKVDTCQGDSGGPATVAVDGHRALLGITSWGDGCAMPNKYGVYSRAYAFREWVKKNTEGQVNW